MLLYKRINGVEEKINLELRTVAELTDIIGRGTSRRMRV